MINKLKLKTLLLTLSLMVTASLINAEDTDDDGDKEGSRSAQDSSAQDGAGAGLVPPTSLRGRTGCWGSSSKPREYAKYYLDNKRLLDAINKIDFRTIELIRSYTAQNFKGHSFKIDLRHLFESRGMRHLEGIRRLESLDKENTKQLIVARILLTAIRRIGSDNFFDRLLADDVAESNMEKMSDGVAEWLWEITRNQRFLAYRNGYLERNGRSSSSLSSSSSALRDCSFTDSLINNFFPGLLSSGSEGQGAGVASVAPVERDSSDPLLDLLGKAQAALLKRSETRNSSASEGRGAGVAPQATSAMPVPSRVPARSPGVPTPGGVYPLSAHSSGIPLPPYYSAYGTPLAYSYGIPPPPYSYGNTTPPRPYYGTYGIPPAHSYGISLPPYYGTYGTPPPAHSSVAPSAPYYGLGQVLPAGYRRVATRRTTTTSRLLPYSRPISTTSATRILPQMPSSQNSGWYTNPLWLALLAQQVAQRNPYSQSRL